MTRMKDLHIDAMILDMDGVLWRGNEPIGKPMSTIKSIQDKGIKISFATNNSTRTREDFLKKMQSFGIQTTKDQIFTSAVSTAKVLKQQYPDGGPVFIIGENGLYTAMENEGFYQDKKKPLAVVVGLDSKVEYEKIKRAGLLIRAGAKFFGTNPDKTLPTPEGLIPGAGSILAAIEAASDTSPTIIGKPNATMFNQALEFLNSAPDQTLVVGDRLETDIAGGQAASCQTALVLSGVATKPDGESWLPKIDYIVPELASIAEML